METRYTHRYIAFLEGEDISLIKDESEKERLSEKAELHDCGVRFIPAPLARFSPDLLAVLKRLIADNVDDRAMSDAHEAIARAEALFADVHYESAVASGCYKPN